VFFLEKTVTGPATEVDLAFLEGRGLLVLEFLLTDVFRVAFGADLGEFLALDGELQLDVNVGLGRGKGYVRVRGAYGEVYSEFAEEIRDFLVEFLTGYDAHFCLSSVIGYKRLAKYIL